jgi:hypothetical protein
VVNPSRWLRPVTVAVVATAIVLAVIVSPGIGTAQTAPTLGTAASFSVLAGSTVTNTGPSVVTGNLGVSPGSAVTGFPPGIVTPPGAIHAGDAVAAQAQSDLTIAYNTLAGQASTDNLTGQDLGGLTLTPGVYTFETSAQLTGTLTLDAQGDPNAVFIFQIGSTLTTASNSSVVVINGGSHCNVYWQVGSSATLGTDTAFQGNILALTSITLNTNAGILGRALARNGAVTMDSNIISNAACFTAAPPDDDVVTPPDDDDVVTPPDDDDVVTPPDDDDVVTPPDDDDVVTPPDDNDVVTPPDDDDVVTPPDDDDVVTPPDDDDVVTPPDDDDVVTPPDDDDVVTPPDDDDVVTPPDDDDVVTPPDNDDVVTPPDDDDVVTPPDDDVTPPVDNGDKGESPPLDDGKITLPKTGSAGFLGDGYQRAIAPSGLMVAAVLLLISGSVYIRTTRHRFE